MLGWDGQDGTRNGSAHFSASAVVQGLGVVHTNLDYDLHLLVPV